MSSQRNQLSKAEENQTNAPLFLFCTTFLLHLPPLFFATYLCCLLLRRRRLTGMRSRRGDVSGRRA